MLYCPLGAKTWVGQPDFFFFFFFFFPLWADISVFNASTHFFSKENGNNKKAFFLKADCRFQDFGVGRKGQQHLF